MKYIYKDEVYIIGYRRLFYRVKTKYSNYRAYVTFDRGFKRRKFLTVFHALSDRLSITRS